MNWFFYLIIFSFNFTLCQNVVDWKVDYNSDSKAIHLTSKIAEGWHLYSQHIDNNVGPVPTSFTFKSSKDFQLTGEVIEPQPIKKYDPNFEAMLDFFEKEAVFIQKIDIKNNGFFEGIINYMVCNETMCLPPVDYKFKIEIKI
jgi:hypothetical protein